MIRRYKIRLIVSALLLTATSLIAQPHCKADAAECAQKIREILASKRYLGVTLIETRWGTVIKEVTPDSPAARAGLKPNDRIVGINNHDCTGADPQEVKQLLMPGGKPEQLIVTIVVSRIGQVHRLRARLGLMPKEKIEMIVQRHLETAHSEDPDEK